MSDRIIVTGGAGYIGSHVCVELLTAGAAVLVIDDFSNSSPQALERIEELTQGPVEHLHANLADSADADRIMEAVKKFRPDSAVHLAGLKAVGESVAEPVRYYRVNIGAALTLVRALDSAGVKRLVFSSSATVYGEDAPNPVKETRPTAPVNPYGRTKLVIENMLKDLQHADPEWRIINLRYFNPVGAHPSGRIGEDPKDIPNNLFPFIAQTAVGRREALAVFGDDYPTRDGTGVRDYIHVCDLARGHLAALDYLDRAAPEQTLDVNLGAGRGYSVLEAVKAFEAASGETIPYRIVGRRPGDAAEIFADPGLAEKLFGWRAKLDLNAMCADHWRWQRDNPEGYATSKR
ncbi:MAG: UDP-glucose 4-epimerase GalE [Parvularculaceae bacterium]